MNTIEWIAIVSSVCTIISFAFNIAQIFQISRMKKEIFLRLQGLYCSFFDIASLVDIVLPGSQDPSNRALHEIRGLTDASRHDIVATCSMLTGKQPVYRHPAGYSSCDINGEIDPHKITEHKKSHFYLAEEMPQYNKTNSTNAKRPRD